MTRSSLIVPGSPPGSLGDEALVGGAIAGLQGVGIPARVVELGTPWYADTLCMASTLTLPKNAPPLVRRAGNKLMRLWLEQRATDVYLACADILDGFYGEGAVVDTLTNLRRLGERGTSVHLVGFSWSNSTPRIISALQEIPNARFAARDPFSRQRFQAQTSLAAFCGSDLGYLFPDMVAPSPPITQQIAQWRSRGMAVVALTPNALWHKRAPHLRESLARLLRHRALSDVGFVLMPHDRRPEQDDLVLAREIMQEAGAPDRMLLADITRFMASRGILAAVDLLITGRMHAGISAISVATPTLMLSHQDKVLGILADADMDGYAISPEQLRDTDAIASLVIRALAEAPARRTVLTSRLPALRHKALAGLVGPDNPLVPQLREGPRARAT